MTSVEDRLREALHQVGSTPIGRLDFELLARRRRRQIRTRWTAAVTLTAAAAVLLSWGAAGIPDAGQATLHPIPATPSIRVVLPENRREPAPALSGRTLTGTAASLAALRGQIVALNFCRSTLAACHYQEVQVSDLPPTLSGYGRIAPGPRVATLGVAVQDSAKDALALVRDQAIGYPIVVDQNGAIASAWDAGSLPYTLIIDAQGRIAGRYPGQTSLAQLSDAVARVAAGPLGQLGIEQPKLPRAGGKNQLVRSFEYAAVQGNQLELTWQNGGCGDASPLAERVARIEVHEDAATVHVLLITEPNPAARPRSAKSVCMGVGLNSTSTVHLKAPLGDRTLYDDARSTPMTVTIQRFPPRPTG